jgi:hypothetical protein
VAQPRAATDLAGSPDIEGRWCVGPRPKANDGVVALRPLIEVSLSLEQSGDKQLGGKRPHQPQV